MKKSFNYFFRLWLIIACSFPCLHGRGQPIPLPDLPTNRIIVLPPNTNTYGLPLTWDGPTNVEGAVDYKLYWQWPGTNVWNQRVYNTNVFGTNVGIIRLPFTNGPPNIWATAVQGGIESDYSQVFTKTNYQTRWAEDSTNLLASWAEIINTRSTIVTTGQQVFYRVHGTNFDNWRTVP